MKEEQFWNYWPLVDGFWSADGSTRSADWTTHYFACRLRKRKPSSTKRVVVAGDRRESNFRAEGNCEIRLKVIESTTADAKTFIVERCHNKKNPTCGTVHTHPIDMLWKVKTSSFLRDIILAEFKKGYSAAAILKELKGSGHEGGRNLFNSVGGEFLDM